MEWGTIQKILQFVQHCVSIIGISIIIAGVVIGTFKFVNYLSKGVLIHQPTNINTIRLELARSIVLGLEFIVAADLIGTITTPDYYEVGLLVIIVAIRTLLSYSISREIVELSKENNPS